MRSSMSKMALYRCKVLIIATESEDPYVKILSVVDPRKNYQVVASYRTRTVMDTRRISLRFKGKYRIPKELVFERSSLDLPDEIELKQRIEELFQEEVKQHDMPHQDRGEKTDVDQIDNRPFEVHESR